LSALHQDKTAPAEPEGRILPVSCRQEGEAPVIRLGLADDEPLHIMGLATLLGAQPDMEIIWRATDGKEALARNAADPADVLLLDVQMPGLSGPATTRELMARGATGRVVILATSDTDGPVMDAIEAGASGLLLTSTPPHGPPPPPPPPPPAPRAASRTTTSGVLSSSTPRAAPTSRSGWSLASAGIR